MNIQRFLLSGKRNIDKKIFQNIIWLIFEKLFKMVLSFFVFALIARYLGPEQFGILNYAIAYVFIITSLIDLGLSGLVVKEIVKNNESSDRILGTTFYLKMFAAIVGFFILLLSISFVEMLEYRLVILLVGIQILIKPLEVIDIYNQANVISKHTVIARNMALTIISSLQIFFILFNYSLIYFAAAQAMEILFSAVFLLILYRKGNRKAKWKFDGRLAKNFLKRSWPLIFSGFAAVLYLKVDQIMILNISGEKELGIYSAAAKISEVWYFLPVAIASSFFPQLVMLRENKEAYNRRLQTFYNKLFQIGLVLSIGVSLSSPILINILFGKNYSEASIMLTIHIWASVFVFMRALLSKWIINEELLMFSLISHGSGVIANIGLNFLLIPSLGGVGAAIATVVAYASSTYLCTFYSKKTISAGIMMSKAFISPFSIVRTLKRKRQRKLESSVNH